MVRFPYRDSVGKMTIGVGFNLDDVGLYVEEIEAILDLRIKRVRRELAVSLADEWNAVAGDEVREAVLIDMAFNLGVTRLKGFVRFRTAVVNKKWKQAGREMLDSRWAEQVGVRAKRLAGMMETGKWPEVSWL